MFQCKAWEHKRKKSLKKDKYGFDEKIAETGRQPVSAEDYQTSKEG